MSTDLLLALAGFIFVASVTPGPNNAMLLASGVNHGFLRTLPHMAGISIGCVVMVILVGFGLGGVLAASPLLYGLLRYAGAIYLLVLAWKIARSAGSISTPGGRDRPMRFLGAAAFQWVNPKAWIIVVGAVTTYAPRQHFLRNVLVVALLFGLINIPTIALWAGCGSAMRRVLDRPSRIRSFNLTMAALLVLSLYPILRE